VGERVIDAHDVLFDGMVGIALHGSGAKPKTAAGQPPITTRPEE